ncbi:hypothetical protein HY468_02510, partial [Candidatus Roizmanbacteria bacterium]|nr:hypothetical protein [Candidatus Roizmanbacteria bacterium]
MTEKSGGQKVIDLLILSAGFAFPAAVVIIGLVGFSMAREDQSRLRQTPYPTRGPLIQTVQATEMVPGLQEQLNQEQPEQIQPTVVIMSTATPVPPPPQEPTATPLQQQGVLYC